MNHPFPKTLCVSLAKGHNRDSTRHIRKLFLALSIIWRYQCVFNFISLKKWVKIYKGNLPAIKTETYLYIKITGEAPLLPHKTSALSWSLPFKTLARREKFLPFKTLAPIYQPREEPLAWRHPMTLACRKVIHDF